MYGHNKIYFMGIYFYYNIKSDLKHFPNSLPSKEWSHWQVLAHQQYNISQEIISYFPCIHSST